jgi:hypothetical protein
VNAKERVCPILWRPWAFEGAMSRGYVSDRRCFAFHDRQREVRVSGGDKPQVKVCTTLVKDYYDASRVTREEGIRKRMSNDAPERTACLRLMRIRVETAVLLHNGTHRRRSSSGGGEAKNGARSWLSSAAKNAAMIGSLYVKSSSRIRRRCERGIDTAFASKNSMV